MATALDIVLAAIRADGPIPVARFMEIALYEPEHGYYARAAQRSGRGGDFHTSVDAGGLFGTLLSNLAAGAWRALGCPDHFDLVEAGAGNGRLARDLMDGLAGANPAAGRATRLTLVERSPAARGAQVRVLGGHRFSSSPDLPGSISGLLYANELLDAFPVHRVEMTASGLVEWYITDESGRLRITRGPVSDPDLATYFDSPGTSLPPGGIADVGLAALRWCRDAGRVLRHGYLLLIDYGREASLLHSSGLATGTLRGFRGHRVRSTSPEEWLANPGEQDLTAHVDFTAVEKALTEQGLVRHAFVDQSRFLASLDLASALDRAGAGPAATLRQRLTARTLVAPDALGGSHQVLLMATPDAPRLPFAFDAPWTR